MLFFLHQKQKILRHFSYFIDGICDIKEQKGKLKHISRLLNHEKNECMVIK